MTRSEAIASIAWVYDACKAEFCTSQAERNKTDAELIAVLEALGVTEDEYKDHI